MAINIPTGIISHPAKNNNIQPDKHANASIIHVAVSIEAGETQLCATARSGPNLSSPSAPFLKS